QARERLLHLGGLAAHHDGRAARWRSERLDRPLHVVGGAGQVAPDDVRRHAEHPHAVEVVQLSVGLARGDLGDVAERGPGSAAASFLRSRSSSTGIDGRRPERSAASRIASWGPLFQTKTPLTGYDQGGFPTLARVVVTNPSPTSSRIIRSTLRTISSVRSS